MKKLFRSIIRAIKARMVKYNSTYNSMRSDEPYRESYVADYWSDLELYNGPKPESVSDLEALAADYKMEPIAVYIDNDPDDDLAR